MPPQAAPKSPRGRSPAASRLAATVHGEWSETTQSIVPSSSPAHSWARLASPRIGGQHLNWVPPSGTSSARNVR